MMMMSDALDAKTKYLILLKKQPVAGDAGFVVDWQDFKSRWIEKYIFIVSWTKAVYNET